MISLRNPILATIAYYDCFDFPLTLLEVHKYLINPSRLTRLAGGLGEIAMGSIAEELDGLCAGRIIEQKNGFYFLAGRESLYSLRIERDKILADKWKKFLRLIKFLALAPYLKGVFASGSMAVGNVSEKSDFDILIIAKSGRLYICRFFLWIISSITRSRRKRYEKTAPDKLCFNHYITDNNLYLAHESLFNAQTYANLKPVMISSGLVDKFYSANIWLNNYIYNFRVQKVFMRRSIRPPAMFRFLAVMAEIILNSPVGNVLERYLKKIQQNRIRQNPVTYQGGGRIVFNDSELEFHPHSFEVAVLDRYNRSLGKLGIVPHSQEKDSGLTH